MRVTLVLPELLGGGAERVFLDLGEGLAGAGHDVELLTVRQGGPLDAAVPPTVRRSSLGGAGVAGSVLPLARHLRARRPDVVLSGLTHMNLVAVAAARLVRPRPVVVVTHHNHLSTAAANAPRRRDRWSPLLVGAGYRLADRIVAVSRGSAEDLAAVARLPRRRIEVACNPVRYDALRTAATAAADHPWLRDSGGPLVVAAGRLTAQKDFPTLLRAMARLPEGVRLLILGEGEDRAALEGLVSALGLAGRVELPGFVANPYPYFAAADVIALSSRWEGLPTVLVEALAFPARIVATDCPSGPHEILEGGRWGTLVPPGDPGALAEGIVAALGAPPADRSLARRPYELDAVVERYLTLLAA